MSKYTPPRAKCRSCGSTTRAESKVCRPCQGLNGDRPSMSTPCLTCGIKTRAKSGVCVPCRGLTPERLTRPCLACRTTTTGLSGYCATCKHQLDGAKAKVQIDPEDALVGGRWVPNVRGVLVWQEWDEEEIRARSAAARRLQRLRKYRGEAA